MIVDPITPAVFAIAALIALRTLGGVPFKTIGYIFIPLLVVSFGTFWSTSLFYDASALSESHVALQVGPLVLTYEALGYGLTITLRLIAIFISSMMFVLTTDPTEFIQSLVQQLRVSFRFGYGILAAYRFVPMLQYELANIRAAHKVRGFDESKGLPHGSGRFAATVCRFLPLHCGKRVGWRWRWTHEASPQALIAPITIKQHSANEITCLSRERLYWLGSHWQFLRRWGYWVKSMHLVSCPRNDSKLRFDDHLGD